MLSIFTFTQKCDFFIIFIVFSHTERSIYTLKQFI